MTKYPNSECETHKNVQTDSPVCIICLKEKVALLEAMYRDQCKCTDDWAEKCASLADRNKRLVVALKAVKPVMVRVSKTSLERVPVYPADEIDAILAEVKGGEE